MWSGTRTHTPANITYRYELCFITYRSYSCSTSTSTTPTTVSIVSQILMQFVRGESTDDEVKGGRYAWGAGQPRRGFAAPISWPPRKRPRPGGGADQDEDDERYFDGDDDEKPPPTAAADMDDPLDAYMAQLDGQQSAPKRPAPSVQQRAAAPAAEEEEDPLDAFMAGIEKKAAAAPAPSQRAAAAAVQQCDEAEDHIASFLEEREAAAAAADAEEDDAEEGRAGGPRKQLGRQQAGKQLELGRPCGRMPPVRQRGSAMVAPSAR